MSTSAGHTIHRGHHHLGWDNALPPVLTVAPGATIEFECLDAYILCSVCGDLRISEIVDRPNWVVSFDFPRVVFE